MKLNTSRIKSKIKKVNLTSILFAAVSLLSITFAWFAFSNTINNQMNIGIGAWSIDIKNKDSNLTNSLNINLDSFYPGMEEYTDTITIYNKGDLDAKINYSINSLRIFDDEITASSLDELLTMLAENYPFTINFQSDSTLIKAGQSVNFYISITWPLDSLDNSKDSEYGEKAYTFHQNEIKKNSNDSSYTIRKDIDLGIDLNVSQWLEDDQEVTDTLYLPGTLIKLDSSKKICTTSCTDYYVINYNNLSDSTYILLKSLSSNNSKSSTYNNLSNSNLLSAKVITKLISTDIFNTYYHIDNISDRLLGYLNTDTDITNKLNFIAENNGYIIFDSSTFSYLDSSTCYWTNTPYGATGKYYAIKKSNNKMILYGESINTSCESTEMITLTKS